MENHELHALLDPYLEEKVSYEGTQYPLPIEIDPYAPVPENFYTTVIPPSMSESEIRAHLEDREWRLNNLYFIKDEQGNKVLFRMNGIQKEIHNNLWFFNIIPKARQLGVTTFFAILYLDQILFNSNKTAVIIAHRQEDMKKIFRYKIKYAWDNLPAWLRAQIGEPVSDNANELLWKDNQGNESSISVSLSTRSGTVQFLHISEFGKICANDPLKAEEIVTGAINSVHTGQFISIESTAAGREGYFYDFTMAAKAAKESNATLTPLDFKLFFFPWWIDPRYVLEGDVTITKEDADYFQSLQDMHKISLTTVQKNWYIKKKMLAKDKMLEEFPSTLDEAFNVSQEGAYFSKEMSRVFQSNRIAPLAYDARYPVNTSWDLGMNDFNVILFTQDVGQQIHFLDCYINRGEGLSHYVNIMDEKKRKNGWRYGKHVFPHDVAVKELSSGKSRKDFLWELGIHDLVIAPKMAITDGIENVRKIFPRFVFDAVNTSKVFTSLQNYRRDYDKQLGVWKDKPRHDDNSHVADAVRTLACVWEEPYIIGAVDNTTPMAKMQDQSFFGRMR